MNIGFALILVVLAAVSGFIWLVDALFFARGRKRRAVGDEPPPRPVLVEYARSFFPVILAVLVVRSFIVEPFRIPSGSMMPTLDVGDFILVNKFEYGLRLPVSNTEILDLGEPERGDVVVFRYPGDPSQNWIKRVIGLPGDVISFRNHHLTINGEPVPKYDTRVYQNDGSDASGKMVRMGARVSTEDLRGVKHAVLTMPGMRRTPEGTWIVPAHSYFVMGDNRDDSMDSRYWGFLPEKNLVGEAFLIWFSWRGFGDGFVAFDRIGTIIE